MITIREAATEAEREAIYRKRYESYVEELNLYREWADHEGRRLVDAEDATGRLLYGLDDGELAGSLRLHMGHDHPLPSSWVRMLGLDALAGEVPHEHMAIITRFTVDRKRRSSTISFQLVAAAFETGCREGTQAAFIDCLPHLIPLYSRLGFRRHGPELFDPDVGVLSPMCLVLADTAYLKARRSPLHAIAVRYFPDEQTPAWAARLFPADGPRVDAEDWSSVFDTLSGIRDGRHRFFAGLAEEEIKPLLDKGHVITCRRGDRFIKADTQYDNMYVVLSGTCEIRAGERVLGLAGPGDLVGEMAFLLQSRRTADVVALEDGVRVLSLNARDVRRLIDTEPRLAGRLLLNLSRILAERLLALRQTTLPATAGREASA